MIFSLTGVMFRVVRVRTSTVISLNSPVYSQHSIMEIVRYMLKKSAVCISPLVILLLLVCILQSTVCSLCFTLKCIKFIKSLWFISQLHLSELFFFVYKNVAKPATHSNNNSTYFKTLWLSCWTAFFRGSPIGLAGCGIWHFFAVIFGIWVKNRGGKRELQLQAGAGFRVFMGLGCGIRKGNRAGYGISIVWW